MSANEDKREAKNRLAADVASSADEVAGFLGRLGFRGAAEKVRAFADGQRRGARIGKQIDDGIETAKAAYDASATKRVVDAVAQKMNERPSPLGRVKRAMKTPRKEGTS